MNGWIMFILSIVLVESITQLITKSELFSPIREFFFNRREKSRFCKWLHALLDCGYCTSVWIGWFIIVTLYFFEDNNIFINLFFGGLILHRLANILHFLIDRLNSNRTRDVDL